MSSVAVIALALVLLSGAQLLKFIEDKNISVEESWISFDRVLFETDKAILRPSSEYQGKGVVAIMKLSNES
ncbi:MAG: hypothetical protein IPG09_04380 [Ignavibacteria bacterium]|nr:hypothetical protein [Ignavibacteria bacterium]